MYKFQKLDGFGVALGMTLIAGTSLAVVNAPANAQTQLPGIVIEGATLGPGPVSGDVDDTDDSVTEGGGSVTPGLASEKIGSAVAVVTGAELEARKVRHAAEALRSLPGVHVSQSGGFGSLTQIRIRGAEGNHTKVLIDGIEASNTSNNEFDFSNLLTADIERIEVLRGGHSGIYGSEAIGGVINIITKGGKGPLTVEAAAEGGGLESSAISGRISGGTDLLWAVASAQVRKSNGFDISPVGTEDDPFRNISASLKTGGTLMPGVIWDFTVRKTDKRLDLDDGTTSFPERSDVALDANNSGTSDILLTGGRIRWDLFDGAFTQIVRGNHNQTQNTFESKSGETTFQSENLSKRMLFAYQATYRFATPELLQTKHALTGLGQFESEKFTPSPSFTDGLERKREQYSAALEYRGEFANAVFFSGVVRHDDNDNFEDFTTWRTSVSIPIQGTGLRPHASVRTSVALPGMFEQFGGTLDFFGNPNLEPEESFSWDVGVEYTLPGTRTVFDVTYFQANLENEIAGFGPNTLQNLDGESERSGIEVSVRSQLLPWLFVGVGYTYLDSTEPDGDVEVRRPEHAAKLDATVKFDEDRGTFNFAAIYNGETKDFNFVRFPATRVTLDEYILIDAALSYKINPSMELFVRGENLLDQDYEEISGFNTRGLTAYAGVKIKLEDPSTASWTKYRD